jgi:hypothetical protein
MRKLVGLLSVLTLGACGSSTTDPGGGGPATYTIVQNQPEMIGAGTRLVAGPFTMPTAGIVSYTITNRSTTTPDHWDIAIVPASELSFFNNGQPYTGAAPHTNVSTQSDSASVPAGTYSIGVLCDNLLEDCQFSLDATMTY